MRAKLLRWLREALVLLLIGGVVMFAVDRWRAPTLPTTFTSTPLQTLDGETVDLAAMSRERPLLVYVWATWCAVCRFTTPSVAAMVAKGDNVLTVAMRSGDDATLAHWLAKKGYAMPVVNDPGGQLARQWQVQVTPTLVVIRNGNVASVTTGWTSGLGMRLRLWWAGVA